MQKLIHLDANILESKNNKNNYIFFVNIFTQPCDSFKYGESFQHFYF